jgi:hypothetical protein
VEELNSNDKAALGAQLAQAQERLEGLEGELRLIEGVLEDLSIERQRHQLLHEICGGLEKLRAVGGEELFWDGHVAEGRGDEHVQVVRGRVDEFHRRVSEIEGSRQAVIEKIQGEQDNSEFIEDDILELEREEEQRKREWLIEREMDDFVVRPAIMPWTRGGEDDKLFRKALAAALLLSLLIGGLLPLIELPVRDRWEVIEVPERLTRLIREETKPPPPPIQVEAEPREIEPEPSEEPILAEKSAAEPSPKQTPKQSAETKGILAFREKFSGLAENRPVARLGAQARINRSGEASSGRPQRSLVTTQGPGSSGGINLAALSRDIGGGGGPEIEGVEVGRATSSIGAISGPERPLSGGPGPARTDEEIQIVFDRHKAALYRLYNRELRRDPTLKGQMVLRIKIEPDGKVTLCEVTSTDMKAPNLAAQVVGRVKTFDFGAKDGVPAITILYPIDFLPAA